MDILYINHCAITLLECKKKPGVVIMLSDINGYEQNVMDMNRMCS